MIESCQTCRFWLRCDCDDIDKDGYPEHGFCRCDPPTGKWHNDARYCWPVSPPDGFCGRYEEKPK